MRKIGILSTLVFVLSFFCHATLDAQEAPAAVHEIGIGFNSTTSFSLRYQWGTDQMIWRITALSLGVTNTSVSQYDVITGVNSNPGIVTYSPIVNTPVNLSGGLNISLAKLKSINERFGLMFGVVAGINLSYLKTSTETDYLYISQLNTTYNSNYTTDASTASYAPFVGILLGARYKVSPSFYLYGEISPNINFTYATTTSTTTPGINTPPNVDKTTYTYGLSGLANSGALITIVYRISGKTQ